LKRCWRDLNILYATCTVIVYDAASFPCLTKTFLRDPLIPYPKSHLSTSFATTRTTHATGITKVEIALPQIVMEKEVFKFLSFFLNYILDFVDFGTSNL